MLWEALFWVMPYWISSLVGISAYGILGRKIVDNVVLLLIIKKSRVFYIVQSLNTLSVFFMEAILVPY